MSSWLVLASPGEGCPDLRPSSGSYLYLCWVIKTTSTAHPICRKWYINNFIACWYWLALTCMTQDYSALFEIHPLPLVFTLVSCNCPSKIEDWNHKWFQMMCVCRARVASFPGSPLILFLFFVGTRGEPWNKARARAIYTNEEVTSS